MSKRKQTKEDERIGFWLSAALECDTTCSEMKNDIEKWFSSFDVDEKGGYQPIQTKTDCVPPGAE